MTLNLTNLLEDLRSGAVRLVPGEATQDMAAAGEVALVDVLRGVDYFMPDDGMRRVLNAAFSASPDPTPTIVEMIEGLVGERDEERQIALTFAGVIAGIDTQEELDEWMRKLPVVAAAEARALAAEAERDALREALARLDRLFTYPVAAEINPRGYGIRADNADGVEFAVEIIRRALTKETADAGE